MAEANPPPGLRMPKELFNNPESRAYFEHIHQILFQHWNRTGGGEDTVTATTIRESYAWDTNGEDEDGIRNLYSALSQEPEPQFNYPVISESVNEWHEVSVNGGTYTAINLDDVKCKKRATIYLPQYPESDGEYIIWNADGSKIKIKGNGKNINGHSDAEIIRKGTSLHIKYNLLADEYRVI